MSQTGVTQENRDPQFSRENPMRLRSILGVFLFVSIVFLSFAAEAENKSLPTLPILIHLAKVEGKSVVPNDWIEERASWANQIFGKHGVSFKVVKRVSLAEKHAKLDTRRDRHALGKYIKKGFINWFIVQSLRDVDEPSRFRQGVHWRPRGYPGKHLVITSSIAGPTVLAHEFGHFFGVRRHSNVPGNIMSYDRGDVEVPFFDKIQISRVRKSVKRFLRTGELNGINQNSNDP